MIFTILILLFTLTAIPFESKIDSLEDLLSKTNNDTVYIEVCTALSKEYFNSSREQALLYAKKALDKAVAIKYAKGEGECLHKLGLHFYRIGDYNVSFDYYNRSIAIKDSIGDRSGLAKSLNNIGNLFKKRGEFQKALEYHARSLEIKEELDDKRGIANSLNNIGIIYFSTGNYEKALEHYIESLKIRQELDDQLGIAMSYTNIGFIYKSQGDIDKALESYENSIAIQEFIEDIVGMAFNFNNIAGVYEEQKDYEKAMEFQLKTIAIWQSLGHKSGIAYAYTHMGQINEAMGNADEAIRVFRESLVLQRSMDDKRGIAICLCLIGTNQLHRVEYGNALINGKACLELATKIGAEIEIRDAYELISNAHAGLGEYAKAFEFHKLYKTKSDTLLEQRLSTSITELQTRQEMDQIEIENELLKKDAVIFEKDAVIKEIELEKKDALLLRRATQRNAFIIGFALLLVLSLVIWRAYQTKHKLSALLNERNAVIESTNNKLGILNKELNDFAYIVSHDLKAPLRGINALATWISQDYGDKLDEAGRENLKLLDSRVHQMHRLIDGILKYSKEGAVTQETETVKLNKVVTDLVDLLAAPKHIDVKVESTLPDMEGNESQLTHLFENLISNAIKFNDKAKGEIKIGHSEDNGNYKFYVADNGPGIDDKYKEQVFKIFQTLHNKDEYESTGIGLSLVQKIINNYGGKIWIESEVGKGCIFWFTLPKS